MTSTAKFELMTNEQILSKFDLLNATIGLTATRFGYIATGTPGIIRLIRKGRNIHPKTRRNITALLLYIEGTHTEPFSPEIKAKIEALGLKLPTAEAPVMEDLES